MKNNLVFLLLLIFVFLTGILSATVYFNRQKIFNPEKTNEKESVSPTNQSDNKANQQETITQPPPSPTQTPIPTKSEFSHWKTYTNNRFGYQFKYDSTWFLYSKCDTDDYCFIQGDISKKGWPDISVGKVFYTGISDLSGLENKLKNDFNDASIKQVVFSAQEIPAVFVSFPRSPQAYASENYYFFHKGEILKISLNDADNNQAQKIYNFFLTNFTLVK